MIRVVRDWTAPFATLAADNKLTLKGYSELRMFILKLKPHCNKSISTLLKKSWKHSCTASIEESAGSFCDNED